MGDTGLRLAGLEPVARLRLGLGSLPIGALPLWRPHSFALQNKAMGPVTPKTWENPFPTPFGGSSPVCSGLKDGNMVAVHG